MRYIVFILLLLFPQIVEAYTETFYVRASGDGSAPETLGGAWDIADINNAGNWDVDDEDDGKLGPNDVALFYDDDGAMTHFYCRQPGLSGKPITLMAGVGESPVIDCNQADAVCIAINQHSYITVQGIHMKDSTWTGIWVSDAVKQDNIIIEDCAFSELGNGVTLHGDNCVVRRCTFNTDCSRAIEFRDIDNAHSQNLLVEQNLIYCNVDGESNSGIAIFGDANGDNADHHQGTIRFNYIEDVEARAIDFHMGDSFIYGNIINGVIDAAVGNGIEVNGPNNLVFGNVIYDAENIAVFMNNDDATDAAPDVQSTVKNNIVLSIGDTDSITAVSNKAGLDPVFDNNCYWDGSGGNSVYYWKGSNYNFTNWKTQCSGDANSMEVDPLFTDAAGDDFTLQSDSPCIDTGTNLGASYDDVLRRDSSWPSSVHTIDQDEYGSGWEMGAYGYGPAVVLGSGGGTCSYSVINSLGVLVTHSGWTLNNVTVSDGVCVIAATVTMNNCIGVNEAYNALDVDNGIVVTANNCCFPSSKAQAEARGGTVTDTDCLWETDPLMVDPANDDFKLKRTSPCRDAGKNSVWAGTANVLDFSGIAITDGSGNIITPGGTVDMGAYEYIVRGRRLSGGGMSLGL